MGDGVVAAGGEGEDAKYGEEREEASGAVFGGSGHGGVPRYGLFCGTFGVFGDGTTDAIS